MYDIDINETMRTGRCSWNRYMDSLKNCEHDWIDYLTKDEKEDQYQKINSAIFSTLSGLGGGSSWKHLFNEQELTDDSSCTAGITDQQFPETGLITRTKFGDVWQLGQHFLYCNNSEDVVLVCGQTEKHGLATLVFTDPPYNFTANSGGPCGRFSKETTTLYTEIDELGLANFNPEIFLGLLPLYFKKGSIAAYIFHSKDSTPDYYGWVRDLRKEKGGNLRGICVTPLVWHKVSSTGNANPIPFGKAHHADIEYLMYIRLNGKWNNKDKAPFAFRGRVLTAPKQIGEHPTVKPVELIENQLLLTTEPNDVVYDPYGGSGSTLLACENTGRRCVITEKLPRFCDLIISRFEGLSGKKAYKVE